MLTPSTAPLWTKCAFSAWINRPATAGAYGAVVVPFIPEPDPASDEARREGIAADWIANGVLRGDAASAAEYDGETAPNGHVVTSDMVRHVQGYIDYCRAQGKVVQAQVPVNIPHLFIRGLADSQVLSDSSTLTIIDLKYGWSIVEAEFNAQLLCEAIALFNPEIHDRVRLTIYQPRPSHPEGKARHWDMDDAELTDAYHWLARKAMEATSPGAKATPGGGHCRYCDGRGRCAALAEATYQAFEHVRGTKLMALDAHALGDELTFVTEALALIKARHSGVEAEVKGRMKRGEYIPKWMFDQRQSDRDWHEPLDVVEQRTGVHPYKMVPKSPAELEKEGADPDIVNELSSRQFTGLKLVPATKRAFSKLFKIAKG
jgi:hypothetical protein